MKKGLVKLFLGSLVVSFSAASLALPFSIVAKDPLPTEVLEGSSVAAYYTITNNTNSLRANNFIKYLPPNVTQVKNDPAVPDLCGETFTLSAKGESEESCTLKLLITGAVNSNAVDPHNHLFACLAGGLTCAGTNDPLNVKKVLVKKIVAVGNYVEAASPHHSHGGIAISADKGLTWAQQVLPIPTEYKQERLNAVSCVDARCVAVGGSLKAEGLRPPSEAVIELSEDSGTTWTSQTLDGPLLPPGATNGMLNAISCIDNECMAVGRYRTRHDNTAHNDLGTAFSNDSGKTWVTAVLPDQINTFGAEFFGVSCRTSGCVGVGWYLVSVNPIRYNSVFAITTDKINWEQTVQQQENSSQQLIAVNCPDDTRCIAVGSQWSTNSHALLTAVIDPSVGSSKFAELPVPPAILNDPDCQNVIKKAELNSVTCTDSNSCVAVGLYQCRTGSQNTPTFSFEVFANTKDGGVTWTQKISKKYNSDIENFPLNTDVLCTNVFCLTTGELVNQDSLFILPFVNRTTNGGQTWIQQVLPLPEVPFAISRAGLTGLSFTTGP